MIRKHDSSEENQQCSSKWINIYFGCCKLFTTIYTHMLNKLIFYTCEKADTICCIYIFICLLFLALFFWHVDSQSKDEKNSSSSNLKTKLKNNWHKLWCDNTIWTIKLEKTELAKLLVLLEVKNDCNTKQIAWKMYS